MKKKETDLIVINDFVFKRVCAFDVINIRQFVKDLTTSRLRIETNIVNIQTSDYIIIENI